MSRSRWSPMIAIAVLLMQAGCGSAPTAPKVKPQSTTAKAQSAQDDISKNPFVLWIKRNYPDAASQIMDQYLSTAVLQPVDPAIEAQRTTLRTQALSTVANELYKNVSNGLPDGLTATLTGSKVHVKGITQRSGQDIAIAFDFNVRIDANGLMWITQPDESLVVKSDSMLVKLFGGNIHQAARSEILKMLDTEGPKNAAKITGLDYSKGGTFRLDPGVAFMHMPAGGF